MIEPHDLHPIARTILESRNIEDRESFLNPDYVRDSHDPFLMKGMSEAVDRVVRAIREGEKIVIYSDYDADGIPGAALFADFLRRAGHSNFTHYLPHRHDEGFGVHVEAIDTIADSGASLVITIDCGIVDVEAAKAAAARGVDLIVTDHHEPGPELPSAVAILDPKQSGCAYPDKGLCGAGVAWKLIQGILAKDRFNLPEGAEKWLLDCVGAATIADMVPLTGENRMLARFGLTVLRKARRPGFAALWSAARVNPVNVTEDDIAFTLAPRINAASRMGKPHDALRLLTAVSADEAREAAVFLESLNNERKGHVAHTVKEIRAKIAQKEPGPVLTIGDTRWKPALLGLVAGSLAQEFRRPVFLWGKGGDGALKGSARSDGSASCLDIMKAAGPVLEQFGGHHMAGGFTVAYERVHELASALDQAIQTLEKKEVTVRNPDMEILLGDADMRLKRSLDILAPFGVGNEKPLFRFTGAIVESARSFGKDGAHTEIQLRSHNGARTKAIAFFVPPNHFEGRLKAETPVSVIGTLEESSFGRSRPELRIRLHDIVTS
jgi:single-stranded-DNA-specific exonuclease